MPLIKPRTRPEEERFCQHTKPKVNEIYLLASPECEAIPSLYCSQTCVFGKQASLSPSSEALDK